MKTRQLNRNAAAADYVQHSISFEEHSAGFDQCDSPSYGQAGRFTKTDRISGLGSLLADVIDPLHQLLELVGKGGFVVAHRAFEK